MADRNMTFSFKIAGMIAGNFKASFNEAATTIKKLQSATVLHTKTLDASKSAFDRNIISAKSYNNAVNQINTLKASKAAFEQNIISAKSYKNICNQLAFPVDTLALTGKIAEQNRANVTKMSKSFAKAGASYISFQRTLGMAQSVLSMTDVASDFQHAMSKVGAITLGSIKDQKQYDAELAKLTNRARELGEKTQFSARQSAEAMSYLGMAGWNAREQLGQAVSHQQQITAGMEDAEHTSNAAAGTAQAIAESAHNIEAGVGEAAGLIDSSQQILGRIRNRGKTYQDKN